MAPLRSRLPYPARRRGMAPFLTAGAALGCLTLLLGCAQDPGPSDRPDADEAWLELENGSNKKVVELNLVEAGLSGLSWGKNQLAGEELGPGDIFQLKQVPCPELFDLRAVSGGGAAHVELALDFPCSEVVSVTVKAFR